MRRPVFFVKKKTWSQWFLTSAYDMFFYSKTSMCDVDVGYRENAFLKGIRDCFE